MKKLTFMLISLLFTHSAFADPILIRINKNSNYRMVVNYQICFREFNLKDTRADCYPIIRNVNFAKGRSARDIKVDNNAMYVRVISAYTFDSQGFQKGSGEYGPEDCKVFYIGSATLDDNHGSEQIECKQT